MNDHATALMDATFAALEREHHAVILSQTALDKHDAIIREDERLRIASDLYGVLCKYPLLPNDATRDLLRVVKLDKPLERDDEQPEPREAGRFNLYGQEVPE